MANNKIARQDLRGTGTAAAAAKALNKVGRNMNNLRMENGANLQKFGGRVVIPASVVSALSLAKFCFGCSIKGATVTIKAGEVQWGTDIFGIGDTDLIITGHLQYIGLEADFTGARLIGPDANLATFRTDADTIRTWLYQFSMVTPGKASLLRVGKPPGNWIIGAEFAPG